MQFLIMSIVLFLVFVLYFRYLFNLCFSFNKKIILLLACLCSIPCLKPNSILFIFEVHFILISFLMTKLMKYIIKKQDKTKLRLLFIIIIPIFISSSILTYGYMNIKDIRKTEYTIYTNKKLDKEFKLTMISDLHYPCSTDKKELLEIVNKIENENSDAIILNGDIIDEYTTDSEKKEVFQTLGRLSKTTPVFYIFGNHDTGEYSLNNHSSYDYLKKLIESYGIEVLADKSVTLDNLTIIGRKDLHQPYRKDILQLTKSIDDNQFNIVLDHHPKDLKASAKSNIYLHLSGHTHAGQVFPAYYIFELFNINELNYGKEKIDDMTAINSSGIGGWGFPIRTQNHSEYVVINIKHKS